MLLDDEYVETITEYRGDYVYVQVKVDGFSQLLWSIECGTDSDNWKLL